MKAIGSELQRLLVVVVILTLIYAFFVWIGAAPASWLTNTTISSPVPPTPETVDKKTVSFAPRSCSPGNGVTPKSVDSAESINKERFGYWLVPVRHTEGKSQEEEFINVPQGSDTFICTMITIGMHLRFVFPDKSDQTIVFRKECIKDRSLCEQFPQGISRIYYSAIEEDGEMEVRIYKQ